MRHYAQDFVGTAYHFAGDIRARLGTREPHRLTVEDRNIVETRRLADIFAKSVLEQANSILSSSSKCAGSPGEIRTPVSR